MDEHLLLFQKVIGDVLGRCVVLAPEDRIRGIEGLDSVAMVHILLMLENEAGIEFDTVDVANIQTIGDVIALLVKHNGTLN